MIVLPESTLKKKHLSVCYHKTRECYAKGAVQIGYESTDSNLADTCTKILTGDNKRQKIELILYYEIYSIIVHDESRSHGELSIVLLES